MKRLMFFCGALGFFLAMTGCNRPSTAYPGEMPTPIYATVPPVVQRGKVYSFIIETSPGDTCQASILFWDKNNNWLQEELPTITADEIGICKWLWRVPESARDGEAELRGRVESKLEGQNIFPSEFCIDKCP
jgi:hypothetical protein